MKWVSLFFIIIFLFQGYMFANYGTTVWVNVYSVWDKTKDFILVITIIGLLRRLRDRRQIISSFKVLAFFLACRIVWDYIVIVARVHINDPYCIQWLFLICWIVIMYILLYKYARMGLYKIGIWLSVFKRRIL